jgi:hypothetical protein
MSQKRLNPCNDPAAEPFEILDPIPNNCDPEPSLRNVSGRPELGWDETDLLDKLGNGASGLCDPMQTGAIINDPKVNSNTLYRYAKGLRGTDEAMRDLFSNIMVIDEAGKAFKVPIVLAPQEKAVAAILQENVRKDNSLVTDRLRLPLMSIESNSYVQDPSRYIYHKALDFVSGYQPNGSDRFARKEHFKRDTVFGVARGIPMNIGYTLHVWTGHIEDMNQIFDQIVTKFSLVAYIRVRGVGWEIPVALDSVANNMEVETGDKNLRVVKFDFGMTAKTFIPQPIQRFKTVLKTRNVFLDGVSDEDTTTVLARLEDAVKDLQ